jgi:glutaredoxin
MRIIRAILGFFILTWDRLTSPEPIPRDPARAKAIADETATWTFYHLEACPFCVKVRREIRRLNLPIRMKDIGREADAARELVEFGKLDQVPCLRIDAASGKPGDARWMYESSAINGFLRGRFPV